MEDDIELEEELEEEETQEPLKQYEVTVNYEETFSFTVEATSKEEALKKAEKPCWENLAAEFDHVYFFQDGLVRTEIIDRHVHIDDDVKEINAS